MNKRIVMISAMAAVTLISIITIISLNHNRQNLTNLPVKNETSVYSEPPATLEPPPTTLPDIETSAAPLVYTIKDYNGKIAVFNSDSNEPENVYDVFVSSFPQIDQNMLRDGITVYSVEELHKTLEDYLS